MKYLLVTPRETLDLGPDLGPLLYKIVREMRAIVRENPGTVSEGLDNLRTLLMAEAGGPKRARESGIEEVAWMMVGLQHTAFLADHT